jgi:outer membrane protein
MKRNYTYVIAIILTVFIVIYFMISKSNVPKIGYINNSKVFDEFVYTKKLKKDYQTSFDMRKQKIDSAQYLISLIERKLNTGSDKQLLTELNNRKIEFEILTKEFEKVNEELTNKFDNQIISQMNSYLRDFSLNNDLDILLSSDDVGSVIYAKKSIDLTDEAIKFINQKFVSGNIK